MEEEQDEATGGDVETGTTTSEETFHYKGKRKVSDVWNYFVKKKEEKKAQCKICGKQLAYHGGTSNLRDHLTNIHPVKYQGCSSTSTSIEGPMDRMFKTKCCSNARSKEITDKIVNMIVRDTRPIRIVECEGFRELIHCLEPGFVMPSRQSIKLIVFRKHQECKSKLTTLLSSVTSLSLTTDIWTSEANDAYITVTVHFIASWEIRSFVLGTREFPGHHTGAAISDAIAEICSEYNIENKVSTIVHDEAANMLLSLRILGDSADEEHFESISCNAHRLQLCLKKGLSVDVIDRMVRCSSKLVGHFKHSALATNALTKRQEQMNINKKKLIQHCATRWNSTFHMLKCLNEMRWPVTAVLSDETVTKRSDRNLDLTSTQWSLAAELVKILEPFDVATTLLCGEERSVISCTLPIVFGLLQHIDSQDDSTLPAITQFKKILKKEITERWKLDELDISKSLVLSTVLDLRFKPWKFFTEEKLEAIKVKLIERMKKVQKHTETDTDAQSSSSDPPPEKKRKTALDFLLGESIELSAPSGCTEVEEITQYFHEKVIPRASDVLKWWKDNSVHYPLLSVIAESVLMTPATSAASERIFSTAGLTANKLRSSLKPSHLDALVFLNKNYKLL